MNWCRIGIYVYPHHPWGKVSDGLSSLIIILNSQNIFNLFFYNFYTVVIDLTNTKQDTFSWEIMSRIVYLYVHMKVTYFFSFHSCIGFFKEMTHMRQSSSSQILWVSGVINRGNFEWVWVFKQSNSFVS